MARTEARGSKMMGRCEPAHRDEKSSRYFLVSVYTKQIRGRKIYVLGTVTQEEPIPLQKPLTVLQAIQEAGGSSDWANRKKIFVLRNIGGKQVRLPFDYQAVIKGQHLEQNITLLPDDTIVVP